MRAINKITVCVYLLVAVLPFTAMMLKAKDQPVFGAVAPAKLPELSYGNFTSESYQKEFTAWFESRLGFKGYAVTTDNALLYHVFGETKPGSQVMLGKDGVLFKDEDIAYYNKDGLALPTQARVDKLADAIARLQKRLAENHQGLVPLIIPSKTSLYRDKVADRWTRDVGQPRPTDIYIYQAFVKALDERKVTYVDARAMYTSGKWPREELWTAEGRHWSQYGSCLAMGEVLRTYTKLTGKAITPDPCIMREKWVEKTAEEYDLWRLLNTWFPPRPTKNLPEIMWQWPQPPEPPSMLVAGTSFGWAMIRYANLSHLFGKIYLDYYNRTVLDWPDDKRSEVHPHSKEWNEIFLGRDLYVLDLLETYLLAPDDSYVDEFVRQLDEALTPVTTGPLVTTGATISKVNDLGVTDSYHYFEVYGTFPNPSAPYEGTVTCEGAPHRANVYYQNANGGQMNIKIENPGPGLCDRTLIPARSLGLQCTFHLQQGQSVGTQVFGSQRVCAGPQGSNGQDADGNCLPGLAGC